MTRIRLIMLSLMAVFAVSAVAATGAQASATVKGPFYRVPCRQVSLANKEKGEWNKKNAVTGVCEERAKIPPLAGEGEFTERLLAGESEPIEVAASGAQVLTASGVTVSCTETSLKAGAVNQFEGSSGENAGKSKETVEYNTCTVAGNGAGCTVTTPITTNPLVNELGYAEKVSATEGKGKLYTIFKPEGTGVTFATLHFATVCTKKGAIAVEVGSGANGIIAEDLNEAGEAVKVGEHETDGEVGKSKFPNTTLTPIWVEKEVAGKGELTELKGGLKVFGTAAKLEGTTNIRPTSHKHWGVHTK